MAIFRRAVHMLRLKGVLVVFLGLVLFSLVVIIFESGFFPGGRSLISEFRFHWIKTEQEQDVYISTPEVNTSCVASSKKLHNEGPHGHSVRSSGQDFRTNKTILLYTPLFEKPIWYALEPDGLHNFMERAQCRIKNCGVTYDLNLFPSADALVFHARDLPNFDYLVDISAGARKPHQRWLYFTSENPENTPDPSPYDGLFNWTMTYKVGSDIRVPPKQYMPLAIGDTRYGMKPLHSKKLIVWISSNCGLVRDEVVYYLQELLPVDVGGACAEKYSRIVTCRPSYENCSETLSEYKFYLAFENAMCTEYVSEKYWRQSLSHDLVPIVMGGGPYENPEIAIPGSFIDMRDFPTIEKLADYILYLDQNDTAYREYFKWKQHYKLWHPPFGDWPYASHWVCELCAMLHRDMPKKVYNDLSKFWSLMDQCYLKDYYIRKLLKGDHG